MDPAKDQMLRDLLMAKMRSQFSLRGSEIGSYGSSGDFFQDRMGPMLRGLASSAEGTMEGEGPLGRYADILGRWFVTNPLEYTGELMGTTDEDIRSLGRGLVAAAQPTGTPSTPFPFNTAGGQALLKGSRDLVQESGWPMKIAEELTASDLMLGGAGGFLTNKRGLGAVKDLIDKGDYTGKQLRDIAGPDFRKQVQKSAAKSQKLGSFFVQPPLKKPPANVVGNERQAVQYIVDSAVKMDKIGGGNVVHWYDIHRPVMKDIFGDYSDLFEDILSVTSQQRDIISNVRLALMVFERKARGQGIDDLGLGKPVMQNIERIFHERPPAGSLRTVEGDLALQTRSQQEPKFKEKYGEGPNPIPTPFGGQTIFAGPKIGEFGEAMQGATDAVTTDTHIAQLLFGIQTPTIDHIYESRRLITMAANQMGWTPRDMQAALWSFNQIRKGVDINDLQSYQKVLRGRYDEINEFLETFLPYGDRKSLQVGRGSGGIPRRSEYGLYTDKEGRPSYGTGSTRALDKLLGPQRNFQEGYIPYGHPERQANLDQFFEGGKEVKLYHGSASPQGTGKFLSFKVAPGELGVHLGTPLAASDRLKSLHLGTVDWDDSKAALSSLKTSKGQAAFQTQLAPDRYPKEKQLNVAEYNVSISNPYYIDMDLGDWSDPGAVHRELIEGWQDGRLMLNPPELLGEYEANVPTHFVATKAEKKKDANTLKEYLKKEGYDSIAYPNEAEGQVFRILPRDNSSPHGYILNRETGEIEPLRSKSERDDWSYAMSHVDVDTEEFYRGPHGVETSMPSLTGKPWTGRGHYSYSYIVFDRKKIKSSTGNVGTYNPRLSDVTKSLAIAGGTGAAVGSSGGGNE